MWFKAVRCSYRYASKDEGNLSNEKGTADTITTALFSCHIVGIKFILAKVYHC